MKKWMIITGLIVLSVISYLFIDSRIIDYTDGTPVKYMELRKEVQDSLVWRGKHDGCVSIEDTVIVRYKPVICFDSDIQYPQAYSHHWRYALCSIRI